MKAELAQQRSLLELAELDAEQARLAHRAANLPEQQEYDTAHGEQRRPLTGWPRWPSRSRTSTVR